MAARASTPAKRTRRNTNPAPVAKTPSPRPALELPRLYTVDELAEIFHCSPRTIRRMMNEDRLEWRKVRGQRLVTAADLERFLAAS